MNFSLKATPLEEHALSAWSQLPDIEMVTDCLSLQDRAFLDSVGELLANARQTSRFAVTLLHSHFEVKGDECLVEAFDADHRQLITTVHPLAEIESREQFIANSWMFDNNPPEDEIEALQVLTWANKGDIPQAPLSDKDAGLIRSLANLFRKFKVSHLFGMALVGQLADSDKIWTEGSDFLGRELVLEQFPLIEAEARNPIKTVWVFDEEGHSLLTRGCCLRTRSGNGHTGAVHPPGR